MGDAGKAAGSDALCREFAPHSGNGIVELTEGFLRCENAGCRPGLAARIRTQNTRTSPIFHAADAKMLIRGLNMRIPPHFVPNVFVAINRARQCGCGS